jgi:hypothetical protein
MNVRWSQTGCYSSFAAVDVGSTVRVRNSPPGAALRGGKAGPKAPDYVGALVEWFRQAAWVAVRWRRRVGDDAAHAVAEALRGRAVTRLVRDGVDRAGVIALWALLAGSRLGCL